MTLALFTIWGTAATALQDIEYVFAGCAGRFSAEMEHAYLVGGDTERLTETRLTFLSLLEATAPPDTGRSILAHRIASKMAQASLLTSASFSTNEFRSRRAQSEAARHRATCQRLLLDS